MLIKRDIIEIIAQKTGLSEKDSKILFDSLFNTIKDNITLEEPVKVRGFGTIKLKRVAEKSQVNLITGETIIVPEHNTLSFRPGFEIEPKPTPVPIEDEIIPEVQTIFEEAPVEEAPVEEAPVDETPVEEVPVEETPAEETPIEETPVEETPAEEIVEESTIEEVPAEEVPAEETPAEETPAEEKPEEEKKPLANGRTPIELGEVKDTLKNKTKLSDKEIEFAFDRVKALVGDDDSKAIELEENDKSVSLHVVTKK